ncbi:MAG: hypothetical protein ACLUPK_06690 [Veillonella sp.]
MSTFPQKHMDVVGMSASTLESIYRSSIIFLQAQRGVQQVVSSTTDGGGPVATALKSGGGKIWYPYNSYD